MKGFTIRTSVMMTKSRRMRLEGKLSWIWETKFAYKIVRKHDGKKQLQRQRLRWEEIIKVGLREVGCEDVNSS